MTDCVRTMPGLLMADFAFAQEMVNEVSFDLDPVMEERLAVRTNNQVVALAMKALQCTRNELTESANAFMSRNVLVFGSPL